MLGAIALAACLVASGCDVGADEAPSSPPVVSTPLEPCDGLDLASASAATLARCEASARSASERLEGSVDGVLASRRAADLAIALARRGIDPEQALERARADLERASRRRGLEGACEAALVLVELDARDRGDPSAAYLEAYRVVRRFEAAADAACVERARRVLSILDAFRPSGAVLAAIDVDPDGDDPSVGLEADAPRAPEAPEGAFERWISAQPASSGVVLDGVAVYGGSSERGTARVVLSLSGLAHFETSELAADDALPRRFVVSLPGVARSERVATLTSVGAGGLLRVRVSDDAEAARVSFDLEGEGEVTLFVLPAPFRIIVDVHEGRAAERPRVGRGLSTVVLDPGHGGDDFGARAFGLMERDITLDLALRVRDILRARVPSTRVILTREENRFVSLEQRTAMANAIDADVFVSIHLNAAWEPVAHGGVTTFVLDASDDRQIVRLAARENGTSEADVGELERILAGLHREEQNEGSLALARELHAATLTAGRRLLPRLYDRGVRRAMFHVLVGARMPAVLVEAAFMTRPEEAEALRTDRYRQALAEGIADGIVRYAQGAGASADVAPERR